MERKRKAEDSPQQQHWDLETLDDQIWGFQDPHSLYHTSAPSGMGQHGRFYQPQEFTGMNGQLYQNYMTSSSASAASLSMQVSYQQQQQQQQPQQQQHSRHISSELDQYGDSNGFSARPSFASLSQYPNDQSYHDNPFQPAPVAQQYFQQPQQPQQQQQPSKQSNHYLGQSQPQQIISSAPKMSNQSYHHQQQQQQQQQSQPQQPQFSSAVDGQYYMTNPQLGANSFQYGADPGHLVSQQLQQAPMYTNATISQIPEIPIQPKQPTTTPAKPAAKAKANPTKKLKQDSSALSSTSSLQPTIPMVSRPPVQSQGQIVRVSSTSSGSGRNSPSSISIPNMYSGANTMPPMISNPLDSQAMGYGHELLTTNSTSMTSGNSDMLLAAVQRAIQNPHEEKICLILNSKVAQKSYGNEKRFFCPPPAVMLIGESWRANGEDPEVKIGIEEDGKDAQVGPLDADGCTVFKNLFISDSDKRKNFTLHVRITSPLGRDFGVFRSKPLKVISKPSKKKQSVKNVELSITHGTTIALFNRIRSQTVSTKYLGVENDALVTKGSIWDAFTVTAVGKNPEPGEELNLLYGMEVILQSTLTGLTSPSLVIHKVEKSDNVVHCDEPISQLHKVALYVKGTDRSYLSATDSAVTMEKSTMSASNEESLSDTASWTIVGTDRVKYRFNDLAMPGGIITPVPVVDHVKIQSKSLVELYGENFSSALTVWFGETPSKTRYRCEEFITCEPPLYSELHGTGGATYCTTRTELPLLLVRRDGAVFHTGHTYTYQVEPVPFNR